MKIKLIDTGKHKIEVIKLIRLFTMLGLKESKELADNLPSILISRSDDISFEQIKKNFEAIGATVEEIKEEINPPAKAAGMDDSDIESDKNPPVQRKKNFDENQKSFNLPTPKLVLKPAIIFALIVALVRAYFSVHLGVFTIFIVFAVAVGVAYFLRKYNLQADKNLGIVSASITFLYFFASIIFNWIFFFVLFGYTLPLNPFSILLSLFSGLNIFVLIAAVLSFFLASNKNIFKDLYAQDPQNENNNPNIMEKKEIRDHKKKKKY